LPAEIKEPRSIVSCS